MYRLFNEVYLDHVDNLQGNFDRIVVSHDAADEWIGYVGDKLAEDWGLKDMPTTWYYTKECDEFIRDIFATYLPKLWAADQTVVIYCDNDAYAGLFSYWVRHLFPSITLEQFRELHFILNLNRSASEDNFSWDCFHTQTAGLRALYFDYAEHNPNVSEFIKKHHTGLPLEYQLVGYLAGETDIEQLADKVRERLRTTIINNVRGLHGRVRFMYHTPQLAKILGGSPTRPMDGECPVKSVRALLATTDLDTLETQLSYPETLRTFKEQYRHDLTLFQRTVVPGLNPEASVDEILTPVNILESVSDQMMLDTYIQAFHEIDRFSLLIPAQEMRVFTHNFFHWVLKQHTAEKSIITPAWV